MSSKVDQVSHRPNLTLRPFSRGEVGRLIAWAESAEFLMQWAGPLFTYPLDEAQLERYVQGAETDPPSRQIFTALETSSGNAVGHIELNNIDRRNRSAMVSRVLIEKASQGKGYGLELVRQVTAIGFRDLRLHRLELVVFDFNQAAIACYKRAGFTIEGRLREARRVGEEYWTLYLMSLLESEWDGRD
jgi:RimJ/RimL family protein N-acetyltransferase